MLTIITPSYNQGEFLERTIQSVISQKLPKNETLEYWVIDGSSQDHSLTILKQQKNSIHADHQSFDYISEPDAGQADAVNKGLSKSQGDIIGWLNSDDTYMPNCFEAVLAFFKQHPDVDVVYGNAIHTDKYDQFVNRYPTQPWLGTQSIKRLCTFCFISQPTVFFRRSVTEKHGALNTRLRYCLDYEFWLRLATAGVKFGYVPKTLAATRLHEQTKTATSGITAHLESIKAQRMYAGKASAYQVLSLAKDYAAQETSLKKKLVSFFTTLRTFSKEDGQGLLFFLSACAALSSFYKTKLTNRLFAP